MSVRPKKWLIIGLLILTSALLSSCSSISLENILPNFGSNESTIVMVEVTFYVQIPLNTPEGEVIYLSTLDEVTGLGVNADAHPLEPAIGEQNLDQGLIYKTTLTVPQHTIIKYRYTRQNQYAVIEHTQSDEQVRYRLAQADNPQEIRDVVSKWSDTKYIWPEPGRISGMILDETSGDPIPGMLISGGGIQTFTTASGRYMLQGLPPGVHNLVVYAPDGSYQIIQQGAEVASQANTEANLNISPREFVDITFLVSVPIGTPEDSVRLVGNLYQLGNTFGNLPGGMNTTPYRIPKLTNAGDNLYGIILSLPVGTEIRYKYTLGDGFWNAEHNENGGFNLRRFIVPEHPIQMTDEVLTWKTGKKDSITFDLWTPDNTPPGEDVYIQFNPYGWTTPLPMTELAPNHWVFILFSPFDIISDLAYRYCREGECGIADDLATMGKSPTGRAVSPNLESQYIADTVDSWAWLESVSPVMSIPQPIVQPRGEQFITGIEFMPGNKAASSVYFSSAIPVIANMNARMIVFTPTWSFTHQVPPVIEPNPNQDPLWLDLSLMSDLAFQHDLQVALHPLPHFPDTPESWWESAPLDFGWWNSWFDQYQNYAIHFADLAEKQGIDMLVLGGDWLSPALPGGKLMNGDPSGVPADSEIRWSEILEEVDAHFSGTIAWSMSLPTSERIPNYFQYIDQVHLNWSPQLSTDQSTSQDALTTQAAHDLENEINDFWSTWIKPDDKLLVLRLAYPSVSGWGENCDSEETETCQGLAVFTNPAPAVPDLEINLDQQAKIYTAYLSAINGKNWISGIISWGYYAPVVLHDKSISVHGKPAEDILQHWFTEFMTQ
ncbi:MAG: hypothetical protein MUO54_12085 [Anaerolineales bacterium]|nr:hypothetical protein [Anaerolineales bacterium]